VEELRHRIGLTGFMFTGRERRIMTTNEKYTFYAFNGRSYPDCNNTANLNVAK